LRGREDRNEAGRDNCEFGGHIESVIRTMVLLKEPF
jgi:hypothetical protein